MKNIYTIISEMTIENLKELKFSYQDTLSINQSDMCPYSYNYWLWKYYTGMITKDENDIVQECENQCALLKSIYQVIFAIQEAPDSYENIYKDISNLLNKYCNGSNEVTEERDKIYGVVSNEITDLWLMRPENFQYEKEFRKLIFMLYVLYGEEKFRTIALDVYHKDKKACTSIDRCSNNDIKHRFLIESKDGAYNQYYGIEECPSDQHSTHTNPREEEQNKPQDDDWIVKHFGKTR